MKTRKNTLIIALLSLLINPISILADELWNSGLMNAPDAPFASSFSESSGLPFYSTDMYQVPEMNSSLSFPNLWDGNILTFNSGLLRTVGGNEGMDFGTGTSDKDNPNYGNDHKDFIPLGDGLLPWVMVVLCWLVIVMTSPVRRGRSQSAEETSMTSPPALSPREGAREAQKTGVSKAFFRG